MFSGVNVSYSCFQYCRKSASKMMSASRIWPVLGFTRDGPMREAGAGRDPLERVVANVARIPRGIIRLLANFDRVVEAGFLKGLVPFQNAVANRLAILERNRLIEPEDDRLFRRRHLGLRIGLFQIPALDVTHEPIFVVLLRIVLAHGEEVADAVIRQPRLVRCLRQLADRIVDVDRHAARIGHRIDVARAARRVRGGHLQLDVLRHSR